MKSFQTERSKAVWFTMMPNLTDSESTWVHPGILVCLVTALQQYMEKIRAGECLTQETHCLPLFKLHIQESTSLLNFRFETQFCIFF